MSEFHVRVIKIGAIEKHSNADTLAVTLVDGGYPVVFKQGDFIEGELAAYIPIDSILPEKPEWEFLGKHKRIKAKRLRGIFSMGLISKVDQSFNVGDNLQEYLGITKWEPNENLPGISRPGGKVLGGDNYQGPIGFNFPEYTDIESIRRYANVLRELNQEVVVFQKIHGCLEETSKILMSDGSLKQINNVSPGDMVKSFQEDAKSMVDAEVAAVLVRKPDNRCVWVNLEFDNGQKLVCTMDHPVLTARGWVLAGELLESDEIINYLLL